MADRILLIRFSAIGDLLLIAPILEALVAQDHSISLLVKDRFRSTASLLQGVDEVRTWETLKGESATAIAAQFDRIIDLQGTAQSKRFTAKQTIAVHTFYKPYIRRSLLLLTKSPRYALTPVVDRYAKAAEVSLSPNRTYAFNLGPARYSNRLVLVIGGSKEGKRLQPEQWIQILKKVEHHNPVLLGGPEDASLAAALCQQFSNCQDATDTSVEQGLAIVKSAKLVVSGDTGFMHAAALMNVPLVSLWGATHPRLGFAPWPARKNQRTILSSASSPVSKHGSVPWWRSNPIIKVDVQEIITAIAETLPGKTKP